MLLKHYEMCINDFVEAYVVTLRKQSVLLRTDRIRVPKLPFFFFFFFFDKLKHKISKKYSFGFRFLTEVKT